MAWAVPWNFDGYGSCVQLWLASQRRLVFVGRGLDGRVCVASAAGKKADANANACLGEMISALSRRALAAPGSFIEWSDPDELGRRSCDNGSVLLVRILPGLPSRLDLDAGRSRFSLAAS